MGIETYMEKTLHVFLKNYYEPCVEKQEIKLGGYIVDILNDNGVTEIQTGSLGVLRTKLTALVKSNKVKVVHPIIRTKYLYWTDPLTGEVSKKRKSTKTGTVYDIFEELYKIKGLLKNKNLSVDALLLDAEEYRNLNGWSRDRKKGSTRIDRYPLEVVEIYTLKNKSDYKKLIPKGLCENFTSSDFAKMANIKVEVARVTLNVLTHLEIVKRIGKEGNKIIYTL